IQELEPLGCGSPDLGEFFRIQLADMDRSNHLVARATELVSHHFQDLHSCNIEKIRREMKMKEGEIKQVLQLLATLKTRPVVSSASSSQVNNTVFPDFIITMEGEDIV